MVAIKAIAYTLYFLGFLVSVLDLIVNLHSPSWSNVVVNLIVVSFLSWLMWRGLSEIT